MFMASDYSNRIFLGHDLIKPRLNTWKLLYQLVLNTLNDRSFQLDTVGHVLLLIKFLEHVSRQTWRWQRRAGNRKEIVWARVWQMPLPADGRHQRPVAAVVANRKATRQPRFTAPQNVTTSAPPTRVGALRVPRITDSASVAVAERAGLGQEEVITRSFPAGGRTQGAYPEDF